MLRRCLATISKLSHPEGADLLIIIVDNESEANNRSIVEEFGVIYVHEPRRGIVHARNAAIKAALSLSADFLAFTGDDCEPSESWLVEMLEAQRRHDADVVRGRVIYRYPEPLPQWIAKGRPKAMAAGRDVRAERPLHVGTNNVLFSGRLIREDGLGLRFDHRFNLIGGEDTDFFVRAFEQGAVTVHSDLPVIFEDVPAERRSFWRQVRRQFQYGGSDTIIDLDRKRYVPVALSVLGRLLNGIFSLTAAIALGAMSGRRFRKYALRSGSKVMYAAGQISVLAGYRYEGYRAIDGR
jgi:glycosyltransferase involved in cell wall biosynthesis